MQLAVVCTLGSLGVTNPSTSKRSFLNEHERNCVLGTRSVLSVRKSPDNIR